MRAIRTFRRSAEQVANARRFVAEVVEHAGIEPSDELLLVTSELVSNAVLHGSGSIEVHVEVRDDRVHLRVHDDGHVAPAPPPAMPETHARGGRGLALVRAMSRAWGSMLDDRGRTTVWADLTIP